METIMQKNKHQLELIEQLGLDMEEKLKLSPLAARIYILLILSSNEGLTFDEIKEIVQASKSSVSVNINILKQLGYINFKTKSGDRKRYFNSTKYAPLASLENYLKSIDKEKNMIEQINAFNVKYYPEKFIDEKSIGAIFEEYLLQKRKLVNKTIEKMMHFQQKRFNCVKL